MKIALVQSPLAWGELQENLQNFDKKMAKSEDCDVILLPEMFTSGCMMIKKSAEVAFAAKESVANAYPVVEEKMLAWAKRQHALVMGSTVYRENGKYYNRLIAAFPEGNCRYYDKRHCFRMGGENEHFTPGDRQLTFEFRGVKIAAFICYDLRFPEWSWNHGEYDVAIYIANWPESRRDDWNRLLRERAIENEAYVIAVNCAGPDLTGLMYRGESCVIAPDGEVRVKCRDYRDDIVVYKVMK